MNHSKFRFLSDPRLSALALLGGSVLGLLAACSSEDGNAAPSKPPVVSLGGGGNTGVGDAGADSGGTSAKGGNTSAGNSNGGTGNVGGRAGDGGEAGDTGGPIANCPADDLGFLNRESKSQKSPFINLKRLGAKATALPVLP